MRVRQLVTPSRARDLHSIPDRQVLPNNIERCDCIPTGPYRIGFRENDHGIRSGLPPPVIPLDQKAQHVAVTLSILGFASGHNFGPLLRRDDLEHLEKNIVVAATRAGNRRPWCRRIGILRHDGRASWPRRRRHIRNRYRHQRIAIVAFLLKHALQIFRSYLVAWAGAVAAAPVAAAPVAAANYALPILVCNREYNSLLHKPVL